MRLTYVSLSLPLALVSTMAIGQLTTASPAQQSAAKSSSAQNAHAKVAHTTKTHHRARRSRSKASSRRGAKRPVYRPEYTQTSVEVMNGASTQRVVFHKDEVARGSAKNTPAPLKVEVVNGTATDTQYFSGDSSRQGQDEKRPVVVAIQSSDTRTVGGNKHPVVTGITAAGPADAKSANGGGQKVATGVAPKPKRSEYQPDAH